MKSLINILATAVSGLWLATAASAGTWTLDAESSKLAFGSIKKDTVGEVHSFEKLSGTVAGDGMVKVEIDLASVQTNIDIRNERMIEHVFKNAPAATLTAQIDMDEVKALGVGETTTLEIEGSLSLVGTEVEIEAELFVARLSEDQVLVTTNDMIFLNAEDAGINAGVTKLMELAKLPGITRTSPVTMRLIFKADEQKAEAAPAASAPLALAELGDVKKGKKVFRKCKACHAVKAGKNGAGPSLYGVIGATAGQVADFSYSSEMAGSGIVWDGETLAGFLADPKKYLKGTTMAFRGLKKEDDIANVIAYLADKTAR